MTSEDVIHSFYIPAFRVKPDVVPGPLHLALVQGHQAGRLPPVLRRVLRHQALGDDRQRHRDGAAATTRPGCAGGTGGKSMVACGRRSSSPSLACVTCHRADRRTARGPTLEGVYGQPGDARRRPHGDRRRGLHPRVDPQPARRRSSPASSRSCRPSRGRSARSSCSQLDRLRQVAGRHRQLARGGTAGRRADRPDAPRPARAPRTRSETTPWTRQHRSALATTAETASSGRTI